MANNTSVQVTGNVVEINFGEEWASPHLKVRTNSKSVQNVQIKVDDQEFEASGSGERNTIIFDRTLDTPCKKISATFTYQVENGDKLESKLNFGGPYDIGRYKTITVVAENGDDADYNDAIFEVSGYLK
uniref:Calcium-mediated lectin domain-containing protein n=1 Tax=Photinus pyralis TaxID=7054 RepID=A0A1Y1MMM4_PHOPY